MSRRRAWLRTWLLPMAVFSAGALAGFVADLVVVPAKDGPWMFAGVIAVLWVVTVGLNMWMAWVSTEGLL